MKIGAVIQVRMTSQRFPGKVLYEIAGKPVLLYLLERLKYCPSLDSIIVATSSDKMDNPIHLFCKKHKVPCYRGSLSNVGERFIGLLDESCFDAFVRVNGDSPLLDQRLVEQGLEIFRNNSHFDMVTNVFPRTYPKGQSVEVLKSSVFRAAFPFFQENEDKEHVTTYFYRNNGNFKIINFSSERNNGHVQLSIDTPQDMSIFERIISSMTRPHWEYTLDEILELYHKAAAF